MRRPAVAPTIVEVAVDSLAGAQAAAAAGAHRLELCSALAEGGLTPSFGLFAAVKAAVAIPVFAMIRPRGGDFLYDAGEFDVMQRDVEHLRQAGADGIVVGALTAAGEIDEPRLSALLAHAAGLPVTFHRAFDLTADAHRALATLRRHGVERVLSSGQAARAIDGAALIRSLVEQAGGDLVVMAGAGVRDTNARAIVAATGVREVHLSATVWRDSAMTFRRAGVPIGAPPADGEFKHRGTDGELVARVVEALR